MDRGRHEAGKALDAMEIRGDIGNGVNGGEGEWKQ